MGNVFSAIPSTKAALQTLIETALPTVQFQYGDNPEQARTERVRLGATEIGDDEVRALSRSGRNRFRESFIVHVIVEVTNQVTPFSSEERAFEILAAIEDALALDPKLGDVPNLMWARSEGKELETTETGERPLTEIDFRIRCVADLGRT